MAGKPNQITRQIKGEIFNSLRNALVAPQGKGKKSWTDLFIKEMLDEARNNPSGPLGQLLAKQLLQDDIISSLDEQTEKLLARDMEFLHYRLVKQLYDKQREVLYDNKVSHKVIATSRRAGKTNLAARMLVDYCIEPNIPCLYIHTKADNCLTQCWPLVIQAAQEIELPISHEDKANMRIEFANGSSIQMAGNKDKSSAPLLRGGKYKLIIIDESQDERNMAELVEDVCEPMLVDYKDSVIVLQGTPPRRPKTYFEKCYNSPGWKKYHFTMNDNPFLNDQEEFIQNVAKNKGISIDDPLILREYRGLFYYDTSAQVWKNAQYYDWKEFETPKDWLINEIENKRFKADFIYCGNDYGFADYNGITALAWDKTRKIGYVFFEDKFNQSTVENIIERNQKMLEASKEVLIKSGSDIKNIMIYGDTSDKSIIHSMQVTYNMPAACAYKYNKEEGISQLADDLRTRIKLPKDGLCQEEIEQTLYERDDNDNITSEISDIFHPDIMMALLYSHRQLIFDNGTHIINEEKVENNNKVNKDDESDFTDEMDIS